METRVYGVDSVECEYIVEGPRGAQPVLLLHGYSFRWKTWVEAGTVAALAEAGYRVVAPDMPYGRSTSCTKRSRSIEFNLNAVDAVIREALGSATPALVGASLGGRVAVHYAVSRSTPPALVLIAPALQSSDPVWGRLRLLRGRTSVAVFWGTRDTIVGRRIVEELAREAGGELIVYEGAGHALYLDQPERFNSDLVSYLNRVYPPGD